MIPIIPADAPAVLTAKGPYRPERCILYNQPFLIYWHYDPVRSGHDLDEAALAGLRKTAQRLSLLLRPFLDQPFTALAWPQPEVVLFRLGAGNHEAHLRMAKKLIQAESTWYVEPLDAIEYRRC